MRSSSEINEYINKKGIAEVRNKNKDKTQNEKLVYASSFLGRFLHKVKREIIDLLVTTETLEDKTITEAPKYFSNLTIVFIGIGKRCLFIALFIYFAASTYELSTRKQQFIGASLDSGDCAPITRTWQGTYKADRNGLWESNKDYLHNLGMYKFEFHSLRVTTDEYMQMMAKFRNSLEILGGQTSRQDLATNMLIWSSWKDYYEINGNRQQLTMTGSPQMILKNNYVQGTVSNVEADCNFQCTSEEYDVSDGALIMTFETSEFYNHSSCNEAVDLFQLGWDPLVTPHYFKIDLDVTSLLTAVSVSTRVNGPDSFQSVELVSKYVENVDFLGTNYSVYQMYDPLYPQSDAIYCIGPSSTGGTTYIGWNCVLNEGNVYGYPIFIHAGANSTYPVECNCATNGHSAECDEFDFLVGLAVFNATANTSTVDKPVDQYPVEFQPFLPIMELLYVEPIVTIATGNKQVFDSAFASIFSQQSANPELTNPEWRKEKYQWCLTFSFGYCSLIMWHSSTTSSLEDFVTDNLYLIHDGACTDSVTTPNFHVLEDNPWADLEEDYYTCFLNPDDAAVEAIGIGIGNASLIYSFAAIMIFFCAAGLSAVVYPNWRYDLTEVYIDRGNNRICSEGRMNIGAIDKNIKKYAYDDSSGKVYNGYFCDYLRCRMRARYKFPSGCVYCEVHKAVDYDDLGTSQECELVLVGTLSNVKYSSWFHFMQNTSSLVEGVLDASDGSGSKQDDVQVLKNETKETSREFDVLERLSNIMSVTNPMSEKVSSEVELQRISDRSKGTGKSDTLDDNRIIEYQQIIERQQHIIDSYQHILSDISSFVKEVKNGRNIHQRTGAVDKSRRFSIRKHHDEGTEDGSSGEEDTECKIS